MKYYSTVLKKFFDDADTLTLAEKDFEESREKERKERKLLKAEKKSRADEIEALIKKRDDIEKEIRELTNQFVKDYGSFHYSQYREYNPTLTLYDIFEMLNGLI